MALLQDFAGVTGPQGVGCRPGFGISLGTAVALGTWNRFFDPGFFLDANNGVYSIGFVDRDANQYVSSGTVTSGAVQDLSEGDFFYDYLGFYGNTQGPGFYLAAPNLAISDVVVSADRFTGIGPYDFDGPLGQIWGGDWCESFVGKFVTDGTVSQAITGVGFMPDVVLLIGAVTSGPNNLHVNSPIFCMGAADASLNQWGMNARSIVETGPAVFGAHCGYYVRKSRWSASDIICIADTLFCCQNGFPWEDPEQSVTGRITSMDADGFTISFSEPYASPPPGQPGLTFGYLCLKGIPPHSYFATGWQYQGETEITTGFKADGLVLAGLGSTTDTIFAGLGGAGDDAIIGMGATDGTRQRCYVGGGVSGLGFGSGRSPSSYAADDGCLVFGDPESETVHSRASFGSFDDDRITISWPQDDGSRRPFGFLAWKSKCRPHNLHVKDP